MLSSSCIIQTFISSKRSIRIVDRVVGYCNQLHHLGKKKPRVADIIETCIMSLSSYLLSIIMLTLSLLTNIVRVEMRAAHRSASSSSVVNIVSRKVSPVSSHLTNAHPFTHNGLDYCIRQAQKDDLALINLCNRANLPENYGVEFYLDQLQKFPELTLVAEKRDSKEFIGYALGQIRAKLQFPTSQYFSSMPTEYEGHIASIAIHKDYRGHKVAMNLMNILHERIATEYGVDRVSLYCRGSNEAALQLYSKALHYNVERVVPHYYADLEDGCYMVASGLLNQVEISRTTVISSASEVSSAQQ